MEHGNSQTSFQSCLEIFPRSSDNGLRCPTDYLIWPGGKTNTARRTPSLKLWGAAYARVLKKMAIEVVLRFHGTWNECDGMYLSG
jgi:hypothetical protein